MLPENVVSEVLKFLSPRDIVRAATVSKTWHSAAISNYAWRLCLNETHFTVFRHTYQLPSFSWYLCFKTLQKGINLGKGRHLFVNTENCRLQIVCSLSDNVIASWSGTVQRYQQVWALSDGFGAHSCSSNRKGNPVFVDWDQIHFPLHLYGILGTYQIMWRVAVDAIVDSEFEKCNKKLLLRCDIAEGPFSQTIVRLLDINEIGLFPKWSLIILGKVHFEGNVDEFGLCSLFLTVKLRTEGSDVKFPLIVDALVLELVNSAYNV